MLRCVLALLCVVPLLARAEEEPYPFWNVDECWGGRDWLLFSPSDPGINAANQHRIREELLAALKRNGGWALVEGHMDAAEAARNSRADLERAEELRDWLVARSEGRFGVVILPPRGYASPFVLTAPGVPEVQNRRVEVRLTHAGAACSHDLRARAIAWFRRNCFPEVRTAFPARCDQILNLLR